MTLWRRMVAGLRHVSLSHSWTAYFLSRCAAIVQKIGVEYVILPLGAWPWDRQAEMAASGFGDRARRGIGRRCTRATATITIVGDCRKSSTGDQHRHRPSPAAAAANGKGRFRAFNDVVCRRSSVSNCCCCWDNSAYCQSDRRNRRRQWDVDDNKADSLDDIRTPASLGPTEKDCRQILLAVFLCLLVLLVLKCRPICYSHLVPSVYIGRFVINSEVHNYNTRSSHSLHLFCTGTFYKQKCIKYKGW